MMNSKRRFAIAFIEGTATVSNPSVTIGQIVGTETAPDLDGFEYQYSMKDNLDAILDLRVGERLKMNFNRDNEDSAGFIKRIE